MKESPGNAKRPPALDEVSFQKLLEAAFVLQEHNQRQRGNESHSDLNASLSAIVETHNLIQTRQLDFPTALSLIAEQAQRMTAASGVAVGIVEAGRLAYRAVTGTASRDALASIPAESSVSAECLLEGKLVQYVNTATVSSPGARVAGNRGIKSLIAAPVYHQGRIAGVLELRFTQPDSFHNRDVGTAQLMAGLVSEAMLVADAVAAKPPVRSEHKALLDALERIGPDLKPAPDESVPQSRSDEVGPPAWVEPDTANPLEDVLRDTQTTCAGCGNPMEEGEAFCGSCGMARPGLAGRSSTQSKVASLWRMQQAAEKSRSSQPAAPPPAQQILNPPTDPLLRPSPAAPKNLTAPPSPDNSKIPSSPAISSTQSSALPADRLSLAWPGSDDAHASTKEAGERNSGALLGGESMLPSFPNSAATLRQNEPETVSGHEEAPEPSSQIRIIPDEVSDSRATTKSAWTSARKTREWLDALKNPRQSWLGSASRWWGQNRANVYVGLAALIFLLSVAMLIVSPSHDRTAANVAPSAHRRKAPPPPEMTLFEKFLVSLGLAEAPDAPAYTGNPNTRVWVDLHTALYYCPGAELYGKTEGGKFTTQRDAQQDRFEPASRKVCD